MKIYHKIRIWLAIKIEWLRPHLLSKKEQDKLIMVEFRSLALLFGYDISDMSDDELKEGVSYVAKEMSKSGISASDAGDALQMALFSDR